MTNITIDSIGFPNEPSIAIDPNNPDHMVAGANLNYIYISVDRGYHWSKDTIHSSYGVWGDPVILADNNNAFYYFHLANNSSIHTWPVWCDRIVMQRMDDISTGILSDGSYTGHVSMPAVADKPGIGIDRNTNTLYAAWTKFDNYGSTVSTDSSYIYFSRSTDRGMSWSVPTRVNNRSGGCVDDDKTVEGAIPVAGPEGQIYLVWAGEDELLFDRSYNGGNTWLPSNIHVADVPGGWDYSIPGLRRCNGMPYTACDLSNSPYNGNIYVNWTDQRNGTDNTDVWLCRSSDHGDTWSAPIRVNDDPGTAHQFLSSMTVDPSSGYIYVMFYDRRNYAPDDSTTDVYLAVSKDGAATFQNYLISTTPFTPNPGCFIGDYTYISAFHGVVRPIWVATYPASSFTHSMVKTAIINDTITGAIKVPGINYDNKIWIYPNPCKDRATLSLDLPAGDKVTANISDITGRIILTIASDLAVISGKTSFELDTRELSDGLYLVNIIANGRNSVQKLVVAR